MVIRNMSEPEPVVLRELLAEPEISVLVGAAVGETRSMR